jgi:hypothetical protein
MRRACAIGAVAALVAVTAAGCGGASRSPVPPPKTTGVGLFMTQILREEINGQWSTQWRALHPGHQRLISQAQYVACSKRMGTNFATGGEVFRVLDVRDEAIHVRGVPEKTSKVVTITFREPGNKKALTYRLHAVRVGAGWRWILGDRFLNALERGRCLDGSLLPATA